MNPVLLKPGSDRRSHVVLMGDAVHTAHFAIGSGTTSFSPTAAFGLYGNFNNYTSTVNREVTDNSFSGRIDHQLSAKDSFFARFNWGKFKLDAPQGQAACCLPTPAEVRTPASDRPA